MMNFLYMNTHETRKVLLTGLLETCKKAAGYANEYNAEAVFFPLQETKKIPYNFKQSYDWVIFTSPAAVRLFYSEPRNTVFSKAAVIGPSTWAALEEKGVTAELIPEEYNASALVKEMKKAVAKGSSVLYPCSALADSTIEKGLESHCIFFRAELYVPEQVDKQTLPEFTDVVFFSASAVRVMFEFYGRECLKGKNVAVIGNKTAAEVKQIFDEDPIIAPQSTAGDTMRALLGPS